MTRLLENSHDLNEHGAELKVVWISRSGRRRAATTTIWRTGSPRPRHHCVRLKTQLLQAAEPVKTLLDDRLESCRAMTRPDDSFIGRNGRPGGSIQTGGSSQEAINGTGPGW